MYDRKSRKKKRNIKQNSIQDSSSSIFIPYNSPVSPLSPNLSSSQRTFNSEYYSTLSSVKDIISPYKTPLYSLSQHDIQPAFILSPDIQVGLSPTGFNNPIENKSNSFVQINVNNLPSAVFGYSSSTNGRCKPLDGSKQVEKSNKSISIKNQDFAYNNSQSSFDNTTGTFQRDSTNNHDYDYSDYDSFGTKNSFLNFIKRDQSDREDLRSERNDRRPSRDRLLTPNSQKSPSSFEGDQSRYYEPIRSLSQPDNKFSIFSPTIPKESTISLTIPRQSTISPRFNNHIEVKSATLPRMIDRDKSTDTSKSNNIVKRLGKKLVGKINKIGNFRKRGRSKNRKHDPNYTNNSFSNSTKNDQLDREGMRFDRSFNSKRSERNERRPSRDRFITLNSQKSPASFEGDQSRYIEPIHSLSQSDNKSSTYPTSNPDIQLGSSPSRFNCLPRPKINNLSNVKAFVSPYKNSLYSISQPDIKSSKYSPSSPDFQHGNSFNSFNHPIENRSTSLSQSNIYNLSNMKATSPYSHSQSDIKSSKYSTSNPDFQLGISPSGYNNPIENRSISLSQSNVQNLSSARANYNSLHSLSQHNIQPIYILSPDIQPVYILNPDIQLGTSPSGFNNLVGTSYSARTTNHDYDSHVSNHSFSNISRPDQLDGENIRLERSFNSKILYRDERGPSLDRSLSPSNSRLLHSSFEGEQSRYYEPIHSLSQHDIRTSNPILQPNNHNFPNIHNLNNWNMNNKENHRFSYDNPVSSSNLTSFPMSQYSSSPTSSSTSSSSPLSQFSPSTSNPSSIILPTAPRESIIHLKSSSEDSTYQPTTELPCQNIYADRYDLLRYYNI